MKKYSVTITETLQRSVTVEAADRTTAEEIVEARWRDSAYILGAENFVGASFSAEKIVPKQSLPASKRNVPSR